MKKTILFLCVLCSFAGNIAAQKKISYSVFTYTEPKNAAPDNTDPMQSVYVINVTPTDYLLIAIWDAQKTKGAAQDYSTFIKLLKEQHTSITDYTREPGIINKTKPTAKWQTSLCKGTQENYTTQKVENISIVLNVVTMGNKTAAVHFASNNMDKCKNVMNSFMNTLKLKIK
jgi:coenzyme F420-reducing hydrogenase delta subunit